MKEVLILVLLLSLASSGLEEKSRPVFQTQAWPCFFDASPLYWTDTGVAWSVMGTVIIYGGTDAFRVSQNGISVYGIPILGRVG